MAAMLFPWCMRAMSDLFWCGHIVECHSPERRARLERACLDVKLRLLMAVLTDAVKRCCTEFMSVLSCRPEVHLACAGHWAVLHFRWNLWAWQLCTQLGGWSGFKCHSAGSR